LPLQRHRRVPSSPARPHAGRRGALVRRPSTVSLCRGSWTGVRTDLSCSGARHPVSARVMGSPRRQSPTSRGTGRQGECLVGASPKPCRGLQRHLLAQHVFPGITFLVRRPSVDTRPNVWAVAAPPPLPALVSPSLLHDDGPCCGDVLPLSSASRSTCRRVARLPQIFDRTLWALRGCVRRVVSVSIPSSCSPRTHAALWRDCSALRQVPARSRFPSLAGRLLTCASAYRTVSGLQTCTAQAEGHDDGHFFY
jgi:hypothetical protein